MRSLFLPVRNFRHSQKLTTAQTHTHAGTSPNALDENSYSPLHAAASWGHADILRYLVERGGDINLTDSDRETPLFVVENVGMAKLVVELGGDPKWTNEDGVTVSFLLLFSFQTRSLHSRLLA